MVRIAPGGVRLAAVPAVAAALSAVVATRRRASAIPAVVLATIAAAVVAFHRDPARRPPSTGVVAPADGTVSMVRETDDRVRVGVYMSATDVHVNRAPLAGTVRSVERRGGGYLPAFDKASERNERVHVDCDQFQVILIAGAVARRIHPYVTAGDELARGERLGHISFGSRVDVILPERYGRGDLRVTEGETVRAGESVIARS